MVLRLPSGTRGRALALGVLCLVVLVGWLGIESPLLSLYHARQDYLDQRTALAEKMANLAGMLPALETETANLEKLARQPGWLLPGMTDALASAQLQEMLGKVAGTSGTVILSLEGVPTRNIGALRKIGLHLTISGKYAAIVEFLAAIHEQSPHLLVNSLQIQGSSDEVHSDATLVANLTVSAFRRGQA